MRIIHRISLDPSDSQRQELIDRGVRFAQPDVLLMEETDPRWSFVASYVENCTVTHFVHTEFSLGELSEATNLVMEATGHHGYPQPEEDFGYTNITYDNTNYCPRCGMGLVQKAPFRMRGEPKWGTKHILQMNWVFDEFFVRIEVWDKVFRKFGIEKLPVVQHKTDKPLESVVQLKVLTTKRKKGRSQPCSARHLLL